MWQLLLILVVCFTFGCMRSENIERGRSRMFQDTTSIKSAIKQYHQLLGFYPEGDNAAVIKAITGDNPKKLVFIELPKESLNLAGEMVDSHGTSYQLNVTAEGKVSIRSAGADRLFGTADDAVSKP